MTTVVIVIHMMVVLAMIGLVLLQRSEGGALGIGGGQGAFLSGRGAGNVLTRSTAVLAFVFFATSLGLALLAKYQSHPGDILNQIPSQSAPATTSETPAPPTPSGAPTSAEQLLQQLGGSSSSSSGGTTSGGPQTPPATTSPGSTTPTAPSPASPAGSSPSAPGATDGAATTPPATNIPATSGAATNGSGTGGSAASGSSSAGSSAPVQELPTPTTLPDTATTPALGPQTPPIVPPAGQ
jgi:preprotein translocase subunit SecG